MVNSFAGQILNTLLPCHCALCGLKAGGSLPICAGCAADLPRNICSCATCAIPIPPAATAIGPRFCGACLAKPPPFCRAYVPWLYDPQFAHLIHRWKFNGDRYLTRLLATLWADAIQLDREADIIVPIPLHWRRQWRRGYNQAELLARDLCRQEPQQRLLVSDLLQRTRRTNAQSTMNADERKANLKTAFTTSRPCDNLHIALVDDVLTTGATAASAATALLEAGASQVDLWCLARTPAPQS